MTTLAEFLDREAERLEGERPARAAALSEWQSAVDGLFRQCEEWIRQADTRGIAQIAYGEVTLRENRLGAYRIKTMTVTVDSQSVTFEPRSRYVGGPLAVEGQQALVQAEGRVDGMVWGTASESLYRAFIGGESVWLIPRRNADVSKTRFLPLTQNLFEHLLLTLLS
jgi:hypothetical protein